MHRLNYRKTVPTTTIETMRAPPHDKDYAAACDSPKIATIFLYRPTQNNLTPPINDIMAVRIFNLRNVPDDEAEAVRELLQQEKIDFYETPAGNWGMSVPALWLRDEALEPRARALIAAYQKERQIKAKAAYEQQKAAGENRTIIDSLRENPLRFLIYMVIIVGLLYISTMPFLNLASE